MFDLDWEGDVFVLGYPDDRSSGVGENSATDNLIFLSRAQWDIKGNVVVVTRGQTEASVEMEGASSSDASKLKVEGSLLIFGDANTEESELDIEKWAHVEVKGILGMYGASVEIEVQNSSNTSLKVDGTFATGLSGTRTNDDFDFEATGDTTLKFDQGKVDDAVESLTELQSNLVFSVPIPDSVGLSAPASRSGVTLYTGFAADLASVEANSVPTGFTLLDGSTPADLTGVVNDQANGDYGIDLDLITENAP
jgi:hypothetical protein